VQPPSPRFLAPAPLGAHRDQFDLAALRHHRTVGYFRAEFGGVALLFPERRFGGAVVCEEGLGAVSVVGVGITADGGLVCRGLAALLLKSELAPGCSYFLEVRESNVAAQTLYRKFGFEEVGRRKKYYANPPETAIVMRVK